MKTETDTFHPGGGMPDGGGGNILSLRDISLAFAAENTGDGDLLLLRNLTLDIPRGEITAVIGGNGSGKSTLFNIISGFQRADSGMVLFDGRRIDAMPAHAIARLGIGRLFQGRQLFPSLTLLENFALADDDSTGEFPFACLARPGRLRRAEAAKKDETCQILTGLFGEGNKYLDMLDTPGGAFSYGEQRLLALARLLMSCHTRLLLLDEPTAGVNPAVCETIEGIIMRMVGENRLTVLLIEHNLPFVRQTASNCAYVVGGRIAAFDTPSAVLGLPEVRAGYLGLAK